MRLHQRDLWFHQFHEYTNERTHTHTYTYLGNLVDVPFFSWKADSFFFYFHVILWDVFLFGIIVFTAIDRKLWMKSWKASKEISFHRTNRLFIWTYFAKHTRHPGDLLKIAKANNILRIIKRYLNKTSIHEEIVFTHTYTHENDVVQLVSMPILWRTRINEGQIPKRLRFIPVDMCIYIQTFILIMCYCCRRYWICSSTDDVSFFSSSWSPCSCEQCCSGLNRNSFFSALHRSLPKKMMIKRNSRLWTILNAK